MRLSIIVSILNSHEIVRRQILWFEKMGLPDDVEIIYLDDDSDPPLEVNTTLKNFRLVKTNESRLDDYRKRGKFADWRVGLARNQGAKLALGEFLLMTDIDYIITRENIEAGRNCQYDKECFRRELAVLDANGNFKNDSATLMEWGLLPERYRTRGRRLAPHPNNFIMRRSTFFGMGGYSEEYRDREYPSGSDRNFKRAWHKYWAAGKATLSPDRTMLYMMPNGHYCGHVDTNPFGFFHTLSRISSIWPPQKWGSK